MKTEEEKRAEFDALDGREQQECIALAEMLEEYLGAEYDQYDLVELNQAIKWNFESLDEMEATPMRSFPVDDVDWKKRCKQLEAELAAKERENEKWAKVYIDNHRSDHVRKGGYRATLMNNGDVWIDR